MTNTSRVEELVNSLEFLVEGAVIPVLASVGVLGNTVSILVLQSPGIDMKVNKANSTEHTITLRLYLKNT